MIGMPNRDNYVFPAIFSYDEDGISIEFPDLPGCVSCADTDEEALYMAKDALRGWLLVAEQYGDKIPEPTKLSDINILDNEKTVLIEVCLAAYRDAYNNRSVKKTLTIPAWLNELAEKENINFSFLLQQALKERMNLKNCQ
ncbi:MAG TPA: type II toxin-antitoxin system HicB family antitoxin, partial [Anaerovoracaceae bacterium]|nr:type II toxin-antitoxin system HicB family antitoxin [Anaerovoracaceae bacterium]